MPHISKRRQQINNLSRKRGRFAAQEEETHEITDVQDEFTLRTCEGDEITNEQIKKVYTKNSRTTLWRQNKKKKEEENARENRTADKSFNNKTPNNTLLNAKALSNSLFNNKALAPSNILIDAKASALSNILLDAEASTSSNILLDAEASTSSNILLDAKTSRSNNRSLLQPSTILQNSSSPIDTTTILRMRLEKVN
ncbi:7225_t:CDS:1 [Dentiscutata erythropus]|uniref:7225_t:CDS:1 n=1 Tax=Dentiscutata erythropus TaxID=1348616 RepID=A0A9N9I992_9GLOM|nr:7225_t:CDS:1 [Dentiscutata erythropus]